MSLPVHVSLLSCSKKKESNSSWSNSSESNGSTSCYLLFSLLTFAFFFNNLIDWFLLITENILLYGLKRRTLILCICQRWPKKAISYFDTSKASIYTHSDFLFVSLSEIFSWCPCSSMIQQPVTEPKSLTHKKSERKVHSLFPHSIGLNKLLEQ